MLISHLNPLTISPDHREHPQRIYHLRLIYNFHEPWKFDQNHLMGTLFSSTFPYLCTNINVNLCKTFEQTYCPSTAVENASGYLIPFFLPSSSYPRPAQKPIWVISLQVMPEVSSHSPISSNLWQEMRDLSKLHLILKYCLRLQTLIYLVGMRVCGYVDRSRTVRLHWCVNENWNYE